MSRLFRVLFILFLIVRLSGAVAQNPMMMGGKQNPMSQFLSVGRFYGKVVDSLSGKPVEFANIQLWGNTFDTTTKKIRKGLITGQLTKMNGDFSLENLSVMGEYTLKISFMGYIPYEQKVSFNINMAEISKKMSRAGNDPTKALSALNAVDVDLGNIKLKPDVKLLKEVEIEGGQPVLELKLDKKVFNVEKNMTTTGGTAENVLKNIPSVNVDMDGNVSLRNSAPQIFVDGRPTTLSLDQIPADAIQEVEIITNPSAKFDASGGGGGIINIVLKKARRFGYNGGVRAGIDSRGRTNLGADINTREGKFNFFTSFFYNQTRSIGNNKVTRNNLSDMRRSVIHQDGDNTMDGRFLMGRAGIDYFLNNRNTFTFSGMVGNGRFNPVDNITSTDSATRPSPAFLYSTERHSETNRTFSSLGGSAQYKHLYPKAGKELTADFNFFDSRSSAEGNFNTDIRTAAPVPVIPVSQQQKGDGNMSMMFMQTDYVNPVTEKFKVEAGARASFRKFISSNNNYTLNSSTGQYELISAQSFSYRFNDDVYALYTTASRELDAISYQAGLRLESSVYHGELIDSGRTFATIFPLSLFPSGFVTYKLSESASFQLSASRRVNRPNFFQLIPFIDYSDSLNLSRGNIALKPEFTNVFELNYSKVYNRSHNFLVTAFMKSTSGLITGYQVSEFNSSMNKTVVINTYENARSAISYGLELTSRNSPYSWLDVTSNLNFFNSRINGDNLETSLTNEQFGWFAKLNTTFRLPKSFSIQLIGDYQSRTILPPGGGGGRWARMGMGGNTPGATAQGYIEPNYGLDVAVKYEFLKNKMASLTLNVADVLKTREFIVNTESPYFTQRSARIRDQQVLRLTFSFRFGKFDASLFKRKNIKTNMEGVQDIMGM